MRCCLFLNVAVTAEFSKGGAVVGTYVVGPHRSDPEAVRLFDSLIPGRAQPADEQMPKAAGEIDSQH
jgi:hypothetical protein